MAKIKFTTINVDGLKVSREFENIRDLKNEYYSSNCDLPANDDEVIYAELYGNQLQISTFEDLLQELGIENFKWCINWMTTKQGGSGSHYSYANTLKEAIEECKQEHMYNHYTNELIRPDLKITDVWQFIQYGE